MKVPLDLNDYTKYKALSIGVGKEYETYAKRQSRVKDYKVLSHDGRNMVLFINITDPQSFSIS